MVLLDERFDRLASNDVLVLLNRINWNLIIFGDNQLLGILDAQHLNHLTVQESHVIELGS